MVEQTGEEIDWDKAPPELEDFPQCVIEGLNIFHSLGNRIYPDVGYVGKDYTTLDLLIDLYNIQEHEKDFLIELLLFLDEREIKESQKRMKSEMDRIKRK